MNSNVQVIISNSDCAPRSLKAAPQNDLTEHSCPNFMNRPSIFVFLFLFWTAPFIAAKNEACTEYTTKTVKYVHYSTSSVLETVYVTVSGRAGGTATTVFTSYASSPVIVTVHASEDTSTVTSVILFTSTIKGSATTTVTTTKTETGLTAISLVTETITAAASTQTVLLETFNSAGRASPVSMGQLAVLAVAVAAILLIQ
jgi:hypothetical protein